MSEAAWTAFERDVPAERHEDILTMLSEAAHGMAHDDVTILDTDELDAINVRVSGIIRIGDNEHWFILQDGNWNGTELHAWDRDGTQHFEPLPRTQWTLAPNDATIDTYLSRGHGPALIKTWDAFMKRPDVAEIPGNYTYDRHVQPGGLIEEHYRKKAAKYDMRLVSTERAAEIRQQLSESTEPEPELETHRRKG